MTPFDHTFLRQVSERVTGSHQAYTVQLGQLPFGIDDVARLQLPNFNPPANYPLDSFICGLVFMILRSCGSSIHKRATLLSRLLKRF